jgi:hypothetical protein
MSKHKIFSELKRLTSLEKTGPSNYMKMVQTGESGIHDYGVGFVCVELYVIKIGETFSPKILISTIDDGGAEAHGQVFENESKALTAIEAAASVLSGIVSLPSLHELNLILRKSGLYIPIQSSFSKI